MNSTVACGTVMNMDVPYLQTGRTSQKARTRDALIAAARELLARGVTPTLEEAAAEAAIGRTTAYRYFPNSRALLAATFPEIEMDSLLGEDAPEDPLARVEIVAERLTQGIIEHEPEYRTQLRLALEGEPAGSERVPLRRGRRTKWVEDALSPLRDRRHDRHRGLRMAYRHGRAFPRGGAGGDALERAHAAAFRA